MKFFARFDSEGLPLAFYTDDIWPENKIPAGAVKITRAAWQEFINNQGARKWVGGKVVAYSGAVAPDALVMVVSAAQAKIALYHAGLLDAVEAAVRAHPYPPVRIWYSDAREWERGFSYVQALGLELGLTDAQVDVLFLAASKII